MPVHHFPDHRTASGRLTRQLSGKRYTMRRHLRQGAHFRNFAGGRRGRRRKWGDLSEGGKQDPVPAAGPPDGRRHTPHRERCEAGRMPDGRDEPGSAGGGVVPMPGPVAQRCAAGEQTRRSLQRPSGGPPYDPQYRSCPPRRTGNRVGLGHSGSDASARDPGSFTSGEVHGSAIGGRRCGPSVRTPAPLTAPGRPAPRRRQSVGSTVRSRRGPRSVRRSSNGQRGSPRFRRSRAAGKPLESIVGCVTR
jgi:hypothetical protein